MPMGKREWIAGAAVVTVVVGALAGNGLLRARTADSPPPPPPPVGQIAESAGAGDNTDGMTFTAGEDSAPALMDETAASPTPAPSPAATGEPVLIVHVTGAVKKPGIYKLKPGARIYEAIEQAGGFAANARQDALNLADLVRDADKYDVPVQGEKLVAPAPARPTIVRGDTAPPTPLPAPQPASTRATVSPAAAKAPVEPPVGRVLGKEPVATVAALTGGGSSGSSADGEGSGSKSDKLRVPGEGFVNINTADADELQRLPGVGATIAGRILDYRQQIGKFADPSQLQDVKGIGPKTFAKMEPFVRVN
ncbi:MAG: hypothetical protein OHK0029_40820 [Armatimonadaceae bacterium]